MTGIDEWDHTCPKCGAVMRVMPETDWCLRDMRTIDAICPNCLHVERLWAVPARKTEEKR